MFVFDCFARVPLDRRTPCTKYLHGERRHRPREQAAGLGARALQEAGRRRVSEPGSGAGTARRLDDGADHPTA